MVDRKFIVRNIPNNATYYIRVDEYRRIRHRFWFDGWEYIDYFRYSSMSSLLEHMGREHLIGDPAYWDINIKRRNK